jgi:hypothetical protein
MQTSSKPLPRLSSAQVAIRCTLRSATMASLAIFSSGFGKSFAALIVVCAMFCVPLALARLEPILGPTLTHWDECAAYVALSLFAAFVF